MIITYASRHKWLKKVASNPFLLFGKNDSSRLRSTISRLDALPIKTNFRILDEQFLTDFLPLYETRIHEKKHPTYFDVRDRTLNNPKGGRQYWCMSLAEDGAIIGGMIFSRNESSLSIAFRAFAREWTRAHLRASPSLYAEYEIARYAHEEGIRVITHGRDRNPYGLNSNIGLAAFKLSVGCLPARSNTYELRTLDTETLTEDALVFVNPSDESLRISRAVLITTPENLTQWERVTKYPKQLRVEVLFRKT